MFLLYLSEYPDIFHEFLFPGDGAIVNFGHKFISEGSCYFFFEAILVFKGGGEFILILMSIFLVFLY